MSLFLIIPNKIQVVLGGFNLSLENSAPTKVVLMKCYTPQSDMAFFLRNIIIPLFLQISS